MGDLTYQKQKPSGAAIKKIGKDSRISRMGKKHIRGGGGVHCTPLPPLKFKG